MKTLPSRAHPKCRDLGCRSFDHLVCPVECELLHRPEPDEFFIPVIPMSVLARKRVPTIAIA